MRWTIASRKPISETSSRPEPGSSVVVASEAKQSIDPQRKHGLLRRLRCSQCRHLPRLRLGHVATPVGGRLIGDARVMRAVGQPGERLAAAEEEIRVEGSPTGQWQVASFNSSSDSRWLIGTTLSWATGSGSISTSKACASAVLPRDTGRDTRIIGCAGRATALRCRGAAGAGALARPDRPNRWTLPITALRVTLPSSAAIWLADSPASQSFFSCSTRSSDQVNTVIACFPSRHAGRSWDDAAMPSLKNSCGQNPLRLAGRDDFARTCTLNSMNSWDQNCRTRCRIRRWKRYNMA